MRLLDEGEAAVVMGAVRREISLNLGLCFPKLTLAEDCSGSICAAYAMFFLTYLTRVLEPIGTEVGTA